MFSLFLCWFLPQFKNMAKITGVSKKAMDVRWTHFLSVKNKVLHECIVKV